MKKRHKWGELENNVFTSQQTCINCKTVRFKLMGNWAYSNTKTTVENPFPPLKLNEGCTYATIKN